MSVFSRKGPKGGVKDGSNNVSDIRHISCAVPPDIFGALQIDDLALSCAYVCSRQGIGRKAPPKVASRQEHSVPGGAALLASGVEHYVEEHQQQHLTPTSAYAFIFGRARFQPSSLAGYQGSDNVILHVLAQALACIKKKSHFARSHLN